MIVIVVLKCLCNGVHAQQLANLHQGESLRNLLFFMLTHGKEVRKVRFLPAAVKATSVMASRMVGKVSFSVRSGYFLTFISVKNSINKLL